MNNHPSINHSDESEGEKDTEQLRKFVAENIKLEQFYELAEGNASEQEMIREIGIVDKGKDLGAMADAVAPELYLLRH